jgi:hypothetical protein
VRAAAALFVDASIDLAITALALGAAMVWARVTRDRS